MAKVGELDDESLTKIYIAARDRRAQRKAAFNDDDSGDKLKQEKIEIEFLRRFQDRGIDSVSIRGVGTAYRSTRSSATVADWDAFLDYVRDKNAWELLERRVNKTALEQIKEVEGDLAPGTNWSETVVINFRGK